jgi:Ca-activated chloride channel family protein
MTFGWPTALLALLCVPALLGIYIWTQRRRRAYALRFTNLALLREVAGPGPGIRRHIPPALFLAGLAAVLLAVARPELVLAVPSDQTSIMLVLDVSGSMAATDMQPTRLGAATEAAAGLIHELPPGAQVGIVSFSQGAFLAAPLSNDGASAERALSRLRPNGGTAVGEGLNLALDELAERPTDSQGNRASAVVVLLSDGESNAGRPPASVADRARAEGVRVDTVGIGQRGGATLIGTQTRVGLDEGTLQQIAHTTGGQYFYAADANALSQVYSDLGSQISWVEQRTEVSALASALGALLFASAGLLGMRWFGRMP